MFTEFFGFELRSRFKNINIYIFAALLFLIVFLLVTTDNVRIGGDYGNVNKNAPFFILSILADLSVIGLFFTTAIMSFTATRDFDNHFDQIMFAAPVSKAGYFFGRFFAAVTAASLIFWGANLAFLIGPYMPWIDGEQVGDLILMPHFVGFWVHVVPNVIFSGSIMYALAILTRSNLYTFVAALVLLVGYSIAGSYMSDLDNQGLAALLDPFCKSAFELETKYWTVSEKNTQTLFLEGYILYNRLLWLGVSALILFFAYKKFSFSTVQSQKKSKSTAKSDDEYRVSYSLSDKVVPRVQLNFGKSTAWAQFFSQTKIEILGVVRSIPFIVIALAAVVNLAASASQAGKLYDTPVNPVTYIMLDVISGSYNIFLFAIVMYFSGVLVWRERDAKINELYDAAPFPSWISFFSKTLALVSLPFLLNILGMLVGMFFQAIKGYYHFETDLYIFDLLILDMSNYILMAILAMFLQVMFDNRYLGYLSLIAIYALQLFAFPAWDIRSNMLRYGVSPSIVYSDMSGYGPYLESVFWFKLYWLLFAGILCILAAAFWVRGKDASFKSRFSYAKIEIGKNYQTGLSLFFLAWFGVGAWVFYNTKILNEITGKNEREEKAVLYEKSYKKYEKVNKPRIVALKCSVDIFPEEFAMTAKTDILLKNKTASPIDSLFVNTSKRYEQVFEIPNAEIVFDDTDLGFRIYKLKNTLQPGDTLKMTYFVKYERKGFANEVSDTDITRNGTFFNSSKILPAFGYTADKILQSKKTRKEKGLPPLERMPEQTDSLALMNTYIDDNSDWVTFEAVVGTSEDQIAIAPGSLISEKTENGRRYFHYKLERPILNFFSFMSARYEVERQKHNGIDIEVYYHKPHAYNVERMVKSMKASLDYYSQNFSQYPHKQCRIIEFPRYATFAQAFPGTMPYSEAIGFIARIDDTEDIDFVYYVVAHEMAHQWWAHQVIGAAVKGATLMSETMSQYSALMVMEKMYGKEKMRKFLQYEADRYLGGRGSEEIKEQPLMYNENQQYIHYRKGSVIMYALRDYIGEDTLNAALKRYVAKVAYQEPPYTTSREFVKFIAEAVPDSLSYLVGDFFEKITLYDNRMTEATAEKLPNGDYKVKCKISVSKFYADSVGNQSLAENLADYIDVGVLSETEENGKKTDKVLDIRRVKFTKKDNELEFIVKEKPLKAAIDPNRLLLDRVPEDNFKKLN
jgi:hypothetical protein